MGLRANPTYRQRRLGMELRRMRMTSGLSVNEAAACAELGPPHLGHIEAARTAIPEAKIRALVEAYGCSSEPLIDALVAMTQASGRGWWSASEYKDSHDPQSRDLAELEATTTSCRSFQLLYIPGLLQTAEYARALFAGGEPEADEALMDKCVSFRLRRQRVLTEGLRFHAVIHETALHMQFVPGDIMGRQIEHLVTMARQPNVCIQILPFRANVYPVRFSAPFVIFEGAVPELSTVYVEHPISSPFTSAPEHIQQFSEAFERLRSIALPPIDPRLEPEFHARKDSLGFIQHHLYTL
ncbi:helix-turn-helix transcriptional regulator [Streptomyces sp. UNOC14_S4]|uniref:helix-turn-helix domain-containing protein n=1 Tax=Streptomyces sp. UNOC14_S4 TaxID=2872340 RepID=UPI001E2BAB6C|nr:helix-turn-helix transcriptional regulator [Streptomyces sp. UNOC14_S4]MCC3771012.1 helix-turn-helix domain-containing protein [Streptomyces sp. UNOC14_S4]